jgi:hypothetical protein
MGSRTRFVSLLVSVSRIRVRRSSLARLGAALLFPLWIAGMAGAGDSVVLYANDFESPNTAPAINCGNSLDTRTINELYGTPSFVYHQVFTVETVFHQDSIPLYSNPQAIGGNYSIGMLSTGQDDRLGLTFDRDGHRFLNVAMNISSIDISGCGGPFGVAAPILKLTLLDSPGGVFDFGQPVLDTATITGEAAPDQWTFHWVFRTESLDAKDATDGHVSIVFDLEQSGYATFDDLSIVASEDPETIDQDLDTIPDDSDNCTSVANPGQEDFNHDGIGEACQCDGRCGDPVPMVGTVSASDALLILRAAVSLVDCPLCICDVNFSQSILASDSLADLRFAVGLPISLQCTGNGGVP